MKKSISRTSGQLTGNPSYEGETLEQMINKLYEQKAVVEGTAPLLYGSRKDGVKAESNIRTDRWAVVQDVAQKAIKSDIAKRADKYKEDEHLSAEIEGPPGVETEV